MIFNPSTQILIAFVALLAIGLVLGEIRMQRIAMSSYVGLVIATFLGGPLYKLLTNVKFVDLGESAIKIILFVATVLLLSFHRKSDFMHKGKISIKSAILSFLTAGFISTSILNMLNQATLNKFLTDYNIVAMLYTFRFWFMGLTAAWIVIMNFWPGAKEDRYHKKY